MTPDLSQYDYFLFDWDGCLAMTLTVGLQVHKDVLAEYGVYVPDAAIVKQFGNLRAAEQFSIAAVDECMEKIWQKFHERTRQVELYPGARETLAHARAHGKIAVVSSQKHDTLWQCLAYHQLDDYFDLVLSGDDVAVHKPHPESIETALAHIGGEKQTAIMFGDSDKDVQAAHNAGVDSVLLYPSEHKLFYDYDNLCSHNPTYVAHGIHEARDWFGGS